MAHPHSHGIIYRGLHIFRTDAGLEESFEVKVGLYKGLVLSPLLFVAVMDVVSINARSGLPSELWYADDLVFMATQWSSLADAWLNGELAFLTRD